MMITEYVINVHGGKGQPCLTHIVSSNIICNANAIMIWNATKVSIQTLVYGNIAVPVYEYLKDFEKDLSVLESIYDRI